MSTTFTTNLPNIAISKIGLGQLVSGSSPNVINISEGTAGQLLVSGGAGGQDYWADGSSVLGADVILVGGNTASSTLSFGAISDVAISILQNNQQVIGISDTQAVTIGASGGTQTHPINGRVRVTGTDSATAFSSVGTGLNILLRNTNGGANTFAGLYFQDPSSTVYRGGIVGQYVSGAGAAVDLVFLNNSTENGRLSAAGAWTLGASGGTQQHKVNGFLSTSLPAVIGSTGAYSDDRRMLIVTGTPAGTNGTTHMGVRNTVTFGSNGTAVNYGYYGGATTSDAVYTVSFFSQFYADNTAKGASSTITRRVAYGGAVPTDGTNNAFISDNTGTFFGNWFINTTSTNPSLFGGNIGVGGQSPTTVYGIVSSMSGAALTGADIVGIGSTNSVASTATSGATAFYSGVTTSNNSFTCARLIQLWLDNNAKGAASTITRRVGALIEQPTDGTNNAALVLGQATLNFTGTWNVYSDSTQPSRFGGGSFIVGSAALSTSATDGFLYIPTCAGAPTGVPTAQTGTVAIVFDTTNNRLYVYDGGWVNVALA